MTARLSTFRLLLFDICMDTSIDQESRRTESSSDQIFLFLAFYDFDSSLPSTMYITPTMSECQPSFIPVLQITDVLVFLYRSIVVCKSKPR